MARLPRLFVPDQPQHIIQRGNNRQTIFADSADYQCFTRLLRDAVRDHALALHAYVLMPNHLHLLATPVEAGVIGRVMQAVGRRYVQYFNARHGRTGTLWEGRYKATVIDGQRYVLLCSRYIELNPVRAGLATDPADWPWSSCAHHVGLGPNPLITDHALYWALGNTPFERQAAYRASFEHDISTVDLGAIRDATNKGWALGDGAFIDQLQGASTRRARPLPKGRPVGRKTGGAGDSDSPTAKQPDGSAPNDYDPN